MNDNYGVGYGKPPKHTQWKKGQSGNPAGRPKNTKNFKTDLEEELFEPVQINEGGRFKTVSKQRALLKRAFDKALKGDMRALEAIVKWASTYLADDEAREIEAALRPDDHAILDRFLAAKATGATDDGEANGGAS